VATVSSLRSQVAALKVRATPERQVRQWEVSLEEGEELCEELRQQLGPHDQVIIRYYPRGYLGIDDASTRGQVMSCWQPGPRGRNRPLIIRQYGVDTSKV
jgi:hypothetical protein